MLKVLPSDDELLVEFVDYAKSNGVTPRWYYINISRSLIVNDLKALIARDVYGTPAFYKVSNITDPTVVRALREMRSGAAEFPIKDLQSKPTEISLNRFYKVNPWTNNLYAVR